LKFSFSVRRCSQSNIVATLTCKYCAYNLGEGASKLTVPVLCMLINHADRTDTIIKRGKLKLESPDHDEPVTASCEIILGSANDICTPAAGFAISRSWQYYFRAQFQV
jgi:hypothetical protein